MSASGGSRSERMAELQLTKVWRDQQREIPERTKVWTEPKLKSGRNKVPVVYYLSRNGQLEHPHFMEVPLSSPQGLFLRDVISRLNVLRGKGMAALYSWSCKRSYKNGFVWHDLSENDFIYPAHGHEYVLKGSELLPETTFLDAVASSRPPPHENLIAAADQEDRTSDRRLRNQSCSSIDFNLHEYSVYKSDSSSGSAAADASTQTDDSCRRRRRPPQEILEEKSKESEVKDETLIRDEIEISPLPSDSSPETLENLMKSNRKLVVVRPAAAAVEASTAKGQQNVPRASKSSVLMQLITCGSISFKDCGAGQGLISQYKMRVPRWAVAVAVG